MKNYVLPVLLVVCISISSFAQSVVFNPGNSGGFGCTGSLGCQPQPNYDVAANNSNGDIFLLKREYSSLSGNYLPEIIKYDAAGNLLLTVELRSGDYRNILADNNNVYVYSVHGDSVVVEGFAQSTLNFIWYRGIYFGNTPVETAGCILASGNVYFGSTDAGGLHLRRLNAGTGAVVSAVDHNTSFPSVIHGGELASTSSAIFFSGWTEEPGTTKGNSTSLFKFSNALTYSWLKRYNKNLSLTNNDDKATHIRIVNNFVYVTGLSQKSSGDYDAILLKYSTGGILQWFKQIDKGFESGADAAIDASNDDVYVMQNSNVFGTRKIFVSRFDNAGTLKWSKAYAGAPSKPYTSGRNIYCDPNPGGTGCEVYVSGVLDCAGTDPHGYENGSSYLFYKYSRGGAKTNYLGAATAFIAGLKALTVARYFPLYTGGPRLILLGDGDNSNPSPGYYGWDMYVYDISSTARLAETPVANDRMMLYPNPGHDVIHVATPGAPDLLQVFDMTGRMVYEMKDANVESTIDVSAWKKGIYFVKGSGEGQEWQSKLVVE